MCLPGSRGAVRPVPRPQRKQEHIQGRAHAVRLFRCSVGVLRGERHLRPRGAVPSRQPLQPGYGPGAYHARYVGLYQVNSRNNIL